MNWLCLSGLSSLLFFAAAPFAFAADPVPGNSDLEIVRQVGPKGQGHAAARQAIQRLNQADPAKLPQVLAAMDGASPLAQNWIRGIAEAMAQRAAAGGAKLPVETLEAFFKDTAHAPRGRRLAYELLVKADPQAEARLIPGLLQDPSLELRRDAVAKALDDAAEAEKTDKPSAIKKYQVAFSAARDQDQIKTAADKLKALGETVDQVTHYGFITTWKLLAPFDNQDEKGWDVAYPPEETIDFKAEYAGKESKIKWSDYTTTHELGLVDLNTALSKYKGAVCYAAAEFVSAKEQEVDLRFACISANKLWLNGKLLMANHNYHASTGEDLDQYVIRGKLQPGKNLILLKICQNEQKEPWAQRWQFQFRVCDEIGTPIFSQDRTLPKTAAK